MCIDLKIGYHFEQAGKPSDWWLTGNTRHLTESIHIEESDWYSGHQEELNAALGTVRHSTEMTTLLMTETIATGVIPELDLSQEKYLMSTKIMMRSNDTAAANTSRL